MENVNLSVTNARVICPRWDACLNPHISSAACQFPRIISANSHVFIRVSFGERKNRHICLLIEWPSRGTPLPLSPRSSFTHSPAKTSFNARWLDTEGNVRWICSAQMLSTEFAKDRRCLPWECWHAVGGAVATLSQRSAISMNFKLHSISRKIFAPPEGQLNYLGPTGVCTIFIYYDLVTTLHGT